MKKEKKKKYTFTVTFLVYLGVSTISGVKADSHKHFTSIPIILEISNNNNEQNDKH